MDLECLLASIICLVIALIMLKLCIYNWKICQKELLKYNNNIYCLDLLYTICCLKISLYFLLPSITHAISNWKPVIMEGVSPWEVIILYLLELISYSIYFSTFTYLIKKYKPRISVSSFSTNQLFITVVLIITIIILYFQNSKVENESILLSYFQPFISKAGVVLAILVLVISNKMNTLNVLCASIVMLLYALFAFTCGVRSNIMWPALLIIYIAYIFNRRRFKFFSIIGLGSLLFLVSFQHLLVANRYDLRNEKSIDKVSTILDSKNKDNKKSLFDEIDFRFGAMTTYGVGYLRMANRGFYAGLTPCINSLYAPIPRNLYPNKPIPCSVIDDSEYGQGMYLSMAEITKIPTTMTEPSTAGHAYWELNFLGVILFSIIPAIYVFYSLRFFSKFSILALPFFYTIFKWEYLEPKLWVSAIILQIIQINFIAFLFYLLYKFLNRRIIFKYKRGNQY